MSSLDVPVTISWFPTAMPKGPPYGDMEHTTWDNFSGVFWWRREGKKDGPNFITARFKLEPGGRQLRYLKENLIACTAVAMDCETNRATGEIPPPFVDTALRIGAEGWTAILYTSHNHREQAPRYRLVVPFSEEIDHELPAVEMVADRLRLSGVLDASKLDASSLFYLPSCQEGQGQEHGVANIPGFFSLLAEWSRSERPVPANDPVAPAASEPTEARRER